MSNNHLFEITLRVYKTAATDLHPRFAGAQIVAYAIASSEQDALSAVRQHLITEGQAVVNEPPRVRELKAEEWDRYVNESWSGMRSLLPSQEEVVSWMGSPRLFFGSL